MTFNLPKDYPVKRPNVLIRNANLNRSIHQLLINKLQDFIMSLPQEEACLYQIIEWIKDNMDDVVETCQSMCEVKEAVNNNMHCHCFSRVWIVSHHIYNTTKRKDIITYAHQLNLNGFSMPGKPGFIVVEGRTEDVDEFWRRIRFMSWQKINIRETEKINDVDATTASQWCRFSSFQENVFSKAELVNLLTEKGLSHMFHSLFGIESKDLPACSDNKR